MDLLVVDAPVMGHDKFEIVAAVRHKGINKEFTSFGFEHLRCFFNELRMGAGMARKTAHICFNDGDRCFWHTRSIISDRFRILKWLGMLDRSVQGFPYG